MTVAWLPASQPRTRKSPIRVVASLEGGEFEVGEASDESEGKPGLRD